MNTQTLTVLSTLIFAGALWCGAEAVPQAWSTANAPPEHLVVSQVRVLTTAGGRLDWGPDGRIVFDRRNSKGKRKLLYDIWVVDPNDPSTERCITSGPGLPVGHRGNPVWHPSGEWILFQGGMKVGNALVTHPGSGVANELWVIRPDGKAITIQSTKLFAADGAWSPDGSAYAGVLLIHERRWPEWLVILEFKDN